jgi:hypothetical protein
MASQGVAWKRRWLMSFPSSHILHCNKRLSIFYTVQAQNVKPVAPIAYPPAKSKQNPNTIFLDPQHSAMQRTGELSQ